MSDVWVRVLFAQAEDKGFPKGTAIAILLFFGAAGAISTLGLFASKERLKAMAGVIGTENLLVARIVCGLGVLVERHRCVGVRAGPPRNVVNARTPAWAP